MRVNRLRFELAVVAALAVAALVADRPAYAQTPPSTSASQEHSTSTGTAEIATSSSTPAGICGRTQQVREKLVTMIPRVQNCADVTDADLAGVEHVVELQSLGITELKAGDFQGLTNLEGLDLSGNALTELPEGIFDGLPNLLALWLSYNSITELPDGAFDDLSELRGLRLDNNALTDLPDGIFDNNVKLTELLLHVNYLTTLPDGIFDNLTRLNTLDLTFNDLTELRDGAFDSLSRLTSLDILGNQLTALPDGAFDNLDRLQHLWLGGNDLRVLSDGIFDDLTKLRYLDIQQMSLSELPVNVFDNLSELETLHLNQNDLTTLPSGVFDSLVDLKVLWLDGNSLATLPDGVFDSQGSLEGLTLQDNSLTVLPDGAFDNLGSLLYLKLERNSLTILPDGIDNLSELELLDLRKNSLTALPQGIEDLSELRELYLSINEIGELPDGMFDNMTNLVKLTMAASGVTGLPEGIKNLTQLEVLDLERMGIDKVPEGFFDNLTSLQDLDLGVNNLSQLPEGVFDNLNDLRVLGLGFNDFTDLPAETFEGVSGLREVVLWGNPGSPFSYFVLLESQGEDSINLRMDKPAPFPVTVQLTAEGGQLSESQIELPMGTSTARTVTVTRNSQDDTPVTVSAQVDVQEEWGWRIVSNGVEVSGVRIITDAPQRLGSSEQGDELQSVCDRTEAVRTAIQDMLAGIEDCADVGADHLRRLTELDLSNSGITSLKAGDFDDLLSVSSLSLDDNGLTTLPSGIFDDLSLLYFLDLNDNGLTSLPEGVFDNLAELLSLELSSNRLVELPDGVFDNLTHLTSLPLGSNRIGVLQDGVFDNLSSLTLLGMSYNGIEQLPDGIFDGLTALQSLHLGNNDIEELPEGAFDNLTELKRLRLSNNNLANVPSAVRELTHLEYLDVSENSIDELPSGTFDNLNSLTYLGLFRNRISSLPDGIFDDLRQLETLYISSNRISELPAGVFDQLTNMSRLGISRNSLIELPDGTFDGLSNLVSVSTDYNIESPLALTARLEWLGENGVAVRIAEGTPFDVAVELAADHGSLSTATVTVPGGGVSSESVTVTPSGDNPVAVSISSAEFILDPTDHISGIEIVLGRPLTLREEVEANQPATGAPQITGTARVGEKLVASTSTIADANGITEADFQFYWVRSDGETDSYIRNAQRHEYSVRHYDVGMTVRVRVKFTDDAGYEETLTSTSTATVPTSVPRWPFFVEVQPTGAGELSVSWRAPSSDGSSEITGYTVQWREAAGSWDTAADVSSTTTTETAYTISGLTVSTRYSIRVIATNSIGDSRPSWAETATAVARISQQPNTPATGSPSISGTARVGETLTAETSGIADSDGRDYAIFTYQWMRVLDPTVSLHIGNATSTSYLATTDDVGHALEVRVSFIDDTGNRESLTSTSTAVVAATVPGAPRSVDVQPGGTGRLTVSWEAPASNGGSDLTGYTVQWKKAVDSWDSSADVSSATTTATSYTITGLSLGTEYSVRVIATNSVGDGPASAEESATAVAQTSHANQNTPATGQPSISGTVQVGETLMADTASIADEDGLDNVSFSYQWLVDDADIAGATTSSHTLTNSDEGKVFKVRVSFTDDGGNDESLTSEPTEAVEPKPNSPATGTLSIHGILKVGETLTVDTSGISDEDGMENAEYTVIEWFVEFEGNGGFWRGAFVDGTYSIAPQDAGKRITARSGFYDDRGFLERVISAPTAEVAATTPDPPRNLTVSPSGVGELNVEWEAPFWELWGDGLVGDGGSPITSYTIQWKDSEGEWGNPSDVSAATTTNTSYTISNLSDNTKYAVRVIATNLVGDGEPSAEERGTVAPAKNSPATGVPTISGTARVEETLTADTSGIADTDGLGSATFSYQWIRNYGTNGYAYISGATGPTYTLVSHDAGKTIQVLVSFTDEADNEETLTSTPTETVDFAVQSQTVNTPATGQPTIVGTPGVGERLTVDLSSIADEDGLENAEYGFVWFGDYSAERRGGRLLADTAQTTLPVPEFLEFEVSWLAAGTAISVQVYFTDDAGNYERLTSEPTEVVPGPLEGFSLMDTTDQSVVATLTYGSEVILDDPANGSYGARVDLAADAQVGSVRLDFSYGQYVRTDNSAPYSLYGEDANGLLGEGLPVGTYYLSATAFSESDQGGDPLQILVVRFTVAEPNSPSTGAPTIVGTPQVGETLTVDTSGISDADGLTNVFYSYQWTAADADIAGAADPTYILVGADQGRTISVWVSFTDDAGNGESLASASTAAVEARSNLTDRPHDLQATVEAGAVIVTWQDPDTHHNYSTYQILRHRPELGEPEPLIYVDYTQSSGSTFTDTEVEPGVLYVYRVKAVVDFFGSLGEASDAAEVRMPDSQTVLEPDPPAPAETNTPATGAPAITGKARVGETLTADTSGISDADGLSNATFSYQWMRNDGSADADIAGATATTYTLVDADEGKYTKVRVSFTDDGGNEETLTSTPTAVVQAAPTPLTASIHDAPENHDGQNSFTFELRFSEEPDPEFSYRTLRDHSFTVTGGAVTNARRLAPPGNVRWEITVLPDSEVEVTVVLPVTADCEDEGAICTGDGRMLSAVATLAVGGPVEEEEQTPAENTPATGVPTISGTAQVGETLMADTSGIADADGLSNATYNYQWIRNDGSADADIHGATDSTFTLTSDDEGKSIKVRVTFTDDDGNEEELTSNAVLELAAEPTDRPHSLTATVSGDVIILTWQDTDNYGGNTYQILRHRPELGEPEPLIYVDYTQSSGSTFTDTEVEPGVLYVYRVKAVVDFFGSLGEASDAAEVRMPDSQTVLEPDPPAPAETNTPATGAPAITGMARVGETLTADTSGIADADGLSSATFSYQWIRNDGSEDTDIAGATATTYTLVDADEGKTIRVRVAFVDDGGNEESLTSAATTVVVSKPNIPATGVPTIGGTAQVGQTLTAETSGISDADGLANAAYGYQWVANAGTSDSDIEGATDSAYTLAAQDSGKTIKVRVSFTDDGGYAETLTSAATTAVLIPTPRRPEEVTVVTAASQELVVSWHAPSTGPLLTGYKVQWRSGTEEFDGSATSTRQAVLDDDDTPTYIIANLTNGTEYTVRVIAYNVHGDSPASAEDTASPEAPNVIVIFVDDLGYEDVSFNGATEIQTTNLDGLAAEGIRFTNGYVTSSVCSPSRAGLLTGRYPARFGMEANIAYNPFDQSLGLTLQETLFPRYLQNAGYYTGAVGKWQLGAARKFTPLQRGFDYYYGMLSGGHDYWKVDASALDYEYLIPLVENTSPVSFTGYLTDALTSKAIEFVNEDRDKPFFLYLPYNAPHGPFQAPQELIDEYSHIHDDNRRKYLAMVHSVDRNVGRLLAALKQSGKRDNTVIFFLSDNGGRGGGPADNGNLRGGKGNLYEGGIRVPFLASWPARWPGGQTYDEMIISLDIAATVLGLAKANVTDQSRPIDGVNLDPFLRGEGGSPHEALFWRSASPVETVRVVRYGDMKLIKTGSETPELFNLATSIGEFRDLFVAERATADILAGLWNQWNSVNAKASVIWGLGDYKERFEQWLAEQAQERVDWVESQEIEQLQTD